MKFCHSCTAPLDMPLFKGPSETHCKMCTDSSGKLHPRAQVQKGIAGWFREWQGDISPDTAMARAAHFMEAMPAWSSIGGKKPAKKAKKTVKKR